MLRFYSTFEKLNLLGGSGSAALRIGVSAIYDTRFTPLTAFKNISPAGKAGDCVFFFHDFAN